MGDTNGLRSARSEKPSNLEDQVKLNEDGLPVTRTIARVHMALILAATLLAGIVLSRIIHVSGQLSMGARYAFSVCGSYAIFFVLIYFWLRSYFGRRTKKTSSDDDGLSDGVAFSLGHGGAETSVDWKGSGGKFAGAGASGDWASDPASIASAAPTLSDFRPSEIFKSKSKTGSRFGDFDLDKDLVVYIFFGLFIAAILGVGVYLIYDAPQLLADASAPMAITAGLLKHARRLRNEGWAYSVLRHTWIPFVLVLGLAALLGWATQAVCPQATQFSEFIQLCYSPK